MKEWEKTMKNWEKTFEELMMLVSIALKNEKTLRADLIEVFIKNLLTQQQIKSINEKIEIIKQYYGTGRFSENECYFLLEQLKDLQSQIELLEK